MPPASKRVNELNRTVRFRELLFQLTSQLYGCSKLTRNYAHAVTAGVVGTKVRVRITHRGATFAALGSVAYAAFEGMGIAFGEIEARDRAILDTWLGENW
jgi:hypothetical protein